MSLGAAIVLVFSLIGVWALASKIGSISYALMRRYLPLWARVVVTFASIVLAAEAIRILLATS